MKKALFVSILICAVWITGCKKEDNVVVPQEEHFAAEGVYLSSSGISVAAIFRGESTDTVKVPLGNSTDHMNVRFFDANRNIINPPTDVNKKLTWNIADTSLVEIWRHDEEYEIHFRGKKPGLTTVEFYITHEGHNDFRSGNLKVLVQ